MNNEELEEDKEPEEINEEVGDCPYCSGTGEGMADGVSCSFCKGRGY